MPDLAIPALPPAWPVSCLFFVDFRGNFVIGKFNSARAGFRLAPLAAAIAMGFAGSAHAATILVNDATEAAGVPGSCTIVDAATSINQASLVGSCTNSGGAFGTNDKIDLSAFASATTIIFKTATVMTPTSALALTKPVTISGNLDSSGRPLLTITRTNEGPLPVRLIDTTANLTLHGIRVFNGRPAGNGGAIQAGVNANLTLINSTVSLSFAGGSGGGIEAQGAVTLINSTVYGNTAADAGGGIHIAGASGSVTSTGSTISGNTTSSSSGGGINANTVTLTNSTISGNSAQGDGGGIYAQNATLKFCTIADNSLLASGIGAGLTIGSALPTPTLTASATLVYGNAPGNDIDSSVAQVFGGDHNLVGVYSRNISVPADTLGCDPILDLLADNGGPTLTHALSTGSCAIDAGPTFPPGTIPSDQRGNQYARRVGSATDIGAYETFLVKTNDRIFYDGFGL
jgi:predicted outer membrane repeat protein